MTHNDDNYNEPEVNNDGEPEKKEPFEEDEELDENQADEEKHLAQIEAERRQTQQREKDTFRSQFESNRDDRRHWDHFRNSEDNPFSRDTGHRRDFPRLPSDYSETRPQNPPMQAHSKEILTAVVIGIVIMLAAFSLWSVHVNKQSGDTHMNDIITTPSATPSAS